eukprot:scaffold593_cov382-Prasinococcus_capsulatus_cf.AAC.26
MPSSLRCQEPQASKGILSWASKKFATSACVIYEQINPHDAFGQQMLRNLEDRGCPLRGLLACDSLAAQTERLLTCGRNEEGRKLEPELVPRRDVCGSSFATARLNVQGGAAGDFRRVGRVALNSRALLHRLCPSRAAPGRTLWPFPGTASSLRSVWVRDTGSSTRDTRFCGLRRPLACA